MEFKNAPIFISILIPAYNEEKRICSTLKKVKDYFEFKKVPYEIIVVDDGSKDNTVMVAKKFFEDSNPEINNKILHLENNCGKGGAIKKGMLTMYQDGIIKVIRGLTSFEELNRVVSEN